MGTRGGIGPESEGKDKERSAEAVKKRARIRNLSEEKEGITYPGKKKHSGLLRSKIERTRGE